MKKILLIMAIFVQCTYAQEYHYYKNNQKISLEPYTSGAGNDDKIDYYKNEKGTIVGVTGQIIIKIADESQIGLYAQEFNLSIEKKLSATLYLVKTADKSRTLETANGLSRKNGVVYAHPDFVKRRVLR